MRSMPCWLPLQYQAQEILRHAQHCRVPLARCTTGFGAIDGLGFHECHLNAQDIRGIMAAKVTSPALFQISLPIR